MTTILKSWALILGLGMSLIYPSLAYSRVYMGECRLEIEPTPRNYSKIWPSLCLNGTLGWSSVSQGRLGLKDQIIEDQNANTLYYGRAYLGAHIWHNVSAHYQALAYTYEEFKTDSSKYHFQSQEIEYAFLQIGNPITTHNSLSLGIIDLPFGLNYRPLEDQLRFQKNSFWPRRDIGLNLYQRNNNQTRYEIGARLKRTGTNKDTIKDAEYYEGSFRASIDLAALEGTKLIASVRGGVDELFYYNLAVFNNNQGAITALEWVRQELPEGSIRKYNQLFRLNHSSVAEGFTQWIIEFEEDYKRHWLLSYQYRIFPINEAVLLSTISHQRSLIAGIPSKWSLLLGMELTL